MSLNDHIDKDKKLLDDPLMSSQARRHVEEELYSLEKYKERHPNTDHDPTSLELFCDENPNASECKIFDV